MTQIKTYNETLSLINSDERFCSFQNFDPELLQDLEYFYELPEDVRKFCYSFTENGTEPYFNEVVDYVKTRIYQELDSSMPKKDNGKKQIAKV